MLIGKKEFIAGLLMATISVSAATKLTSLHAVEKKYSSEVEFSQRIGLFDSESLSEKTLRSNIAEIAFYRGLNLILVDKGIVKSFNPRNLENLGVTKTVAPMNSITRQKAAETILRALMYAQNNGMINVPSDFSKVSFRDWTPDDKYQQIAAFAVKNKIINGTGRNQFRPNKKLTVKEALIFLQAVYELDVKPNNTAKNGEGIFSPAIEQELQAAQTTQIQTIFIEPELEKYFKDISSTNPMADTMKKLINAGAFDKTNLNNELSLPKSIKTSDFALVCGGMLYKTGKTELVKPIEDIVNSVNPYEPLTRNTVAQIGAVMVNAYPHKEYNIKANYTDVQEGTPIDNALKAIAKSGIRMGYSDGSFKGEEKVSRYEAFSFLGIIVGDNVDTKIKVQKVVKEAPKAPSKVESVKPTSEPRKEEPKQVNVQNKVNQDSKLEKQLNNDYEGLSFQERIEKRKEQFRKILNRQSTK